MFIEIKITPEIYAAAKRRRELIRTASDFDSMAPEAWMKQFKVCTEQLAVALAVAIDASGIDEDDL